MKQTTSGKNERDILQKQTPFDKITHYLAKVEDIWLKYLTFYYQKWKFAIYQKQTTFIKSSHHVSTKMSIYSQ